MFGWQNLQLTSYVVIVKIKAAKIFVKNFQFEILAK